MKPACLYFKAHQVRGHRRAGGHLSGCSAEKVNWGEPVPRAFREAAIRADVAKDTVQVFPVCFGAKTLT